MSIKPITRADWIEALRSGRYRQARMVLDDGDGGYCCLGVACKVAGAPTSVDGDSDISDLTLYEETRPVAEALRLSDDDCYFLSDANDHGKTFAEIAYIIERAGDGEVKA